MTTSIQWCDETWNPSVGCTRVSKGCENCYAEGVAHRGMSPSHVGLTTLGPKGPRWNGTVRFYPERLSKPLRWKKPRRVFVDSMSDLFHEELTFSQIAAVWGVMSFAQQHTFQVLTKRPERALKFFAWLLTDTRHNAMYKTDRDRCITRVHDIAGKMMVGYGEPTSVPSSGYSWPLSNVWLGVSVEDQASADDRIPKLFECEAAVRWVSYEPALGPVDFSRFMWPVHPRWPAKYRSHVDALAAGEEVTYHRQCLVAAPARFIDWIVVGGESTSGARPFDLAWARDVVDDALASRVPVFVKQLGNRPIDSAQGLTYRRAWWGSKGDRFEEWPPDLRVREWPAVSDA